MYGRDCDGTFVTRRVTGFGQGFSPSAIELDRKCPLHPVLADKVSRGTQIALYPSLTPITDHSILAAKAAQVCNLTDSDCLQDRARFAVSCPQAESIFGSSGFRNSASSSPQEDRRA